MAIIRWDPLNDVGLLQSQMSRLLDSVLDQGTLSGRLRPWLPPMDLVEEGNEFVVKADLPGLDESDINIELQDNVLTISGERKLATENSTNEMYQVERSYGTFTRSLVLPQGVDPEKIDATFDRGVLEVHVPQAQPAAPGEDQPQERTAAHHRGLSFLDERQVKEESRSAQDRADHELRHAAEALRQRASATMSRLIFERPHATKDLVVTDTTQLEDVQIGDTIIEAAPRLGVPTRRGKVVDLLGDTQHQRLLVRWDNGHESIFYPGSAASIEHVHTSRAD